MKNFYRIFLTIFLSFFLASYVFAVDQDFDIDNDTKIDDAFLDMATDVNGPVRCNGAGDCTAYVPTDEAVGSGWNADTEAPRKDNLHDWLVVFDTDYDGDIDQLTIDATADDMADHGFRGLRMSGRNGDATVTIFNPVYWKDTDNEYQMSDADVSTTVPARGFAAAAGGGGPLVILLEGVLRDDSMVWPAANYGDTLFLSDDLTTCDSITCHGITRTAPSTSGDYIQALGWIIDDDHVFLKVDRGYFVP